MYSHRASLGRVELAFTDRHGGVSGGSFGSLNLALEGADDQGDTATNLSLVVADFAPDLAGQRGGRDLAVAQIPVAQMPVAQMPVAQMRQVHGAHVDVVEDRRSPDIPEADALVTTRPDVVLVVRAADCVPVVLADPDAGVIAVAHCGRPGLVAGVVPAAVAVMRQRGADRISAWMGPHVCGSCYEVPQRLQDDVAAVQPEARAMTSWGTPSLDLGAGVVAQLRGAGVEVVDVSRCTREADDLYSYRRDGAGAGRLAGLARLRSGVVS